MSLTARDACQGCYFNEVKQASSQNALPMSAGRILKAKPTKLPRIGLEGYYTVPECSSK